MAISPWPFLQPRYLEHMEEQDRRMVRLIKVLLTMTSIVSQAQSLQVKEMFIRPGKGELLASTILAILYSLSITLSLEELIGRMFRGTGGLRPDFIYPGQAAAG